MGQVRTQNKNDAEASNSVAKPAATAKEELEVAAYYRWVERGRPVGDELDDWLAVENKWRDNIVPSRND